MDQIHKYPRTRHIEGSRLQPGDEDLSAVPLSDLEDRVLVIEEKIDGANAAISFSPVGELLLQSRGHYLTGGHRERHFDLLKSWAAAHREVLRDRLGSRYVMYGEWVYAKHTIFYDSLPHYFLEFDILDASNGLFLSTEERRKLLAGSPIVSVPVLASGSFRRAGAITEQLGTSQFKSPSWLEELQRTAADLGLEVTRVLAQSDPSDLMEGLYIKAESQGVVTGRYKFVRHDFLACVLESDSHWHTRPIVPNALAPGVDIFDMP